MHIAWGERAKSNCYSPDTTQNKTTQHNRTGQRATKLATCNLQLVCVFFQCGCLMLYA